MGAMLVRVLIVDDHALFRRGLRLLLQAAKDIEVVAEAGDGEEAVRLAERWAPDVVLMDVAMPRLDGIEATRRIRAAVRGTRVVALTMHTDASVAEAMRDAGAAAFLDKSSDLSVLVDTIRAVAAGDRHPSGAATRRSSRPPRAAPRPPRLSRREREVLSLIAQGCSTKEVARRLGISVKTVETHRARIMDKLDIKSVAGLTKYAITRGLLAT